MMIDPDIEACHELRCALLFLHRPIVFLACRGWWQAEGSKTSLKTLSVQVSMDMVTMVTMATMTTIIAVSFKNLFNWASIYVVCSKGQRGGDGGKERIIAEVNQYRPWRYEEHKNPCT